MSGVSRSKTRVAGFANPELDFQLLRQLGSTAYGGASVGECLAVAQRIGDAGPQAWVAEFTSLARSLEADGDRRVAKGHGVSAHDQLLAASNAYRAAEYFAPVDAPAHASLGLKSRECFQRAMEHAPFSLETFFVPHESTALPACLVTPQDAGEAPRPTLLAVSGYDGTIEETYLQVGRAALERGFNVCLFAGPGQMDTLRYAPGSAFEPDYERGVSTLMDMLLPREGVDPDRVAMYGISIGGYFAPRAVSGEQRIKALVANSPIVSVFEYMCGFIGMDPLRDMSDDEDFTPMDLPEIPDTVMSPHIKEMSRTLMLRYGQPSFKAVFRRMQAFSLEGRLDNIACPCLAMEGEGEGEGARQQTERFCQGVAGAVTRRTYSQAEGADSHCQVGNLRLAAADVLDWLEEVFH